MGSASGAPFCHAVSRMRRFFEHNDLIRGVKTSIEWNERWRRGSWSVAATEEKKRQRQTLGQSLRRVKGIFRRTANQQLSHRPASRGRRFLLASLRNQQEERDCAFCFVRPFVFVLFFCLTLTEPLRLVLQPPAPIRLCVS